MGFVKKSEIFCMGFVKKSEVFAWVLQKRQPSHIKRMTAFFDNSILSDKKALLLDFLRQHRHGSVLCADVSADLNGTFVSFRHGHASEDRGAEGACE